LAGGERAAGREAGLRPGARADLLALDPSTPDLAGRRGDRILDAFVFARGDAVRHVWSGGRHAVRDGRHVAHDLIAARYATTLARLLEAM
ncbi:formimidoylglutamate deiminase, partial [Aquicoccus sp. SCR17]|nr:formimidoylglutamate deiminase [Carideicomes alvinocaridis]